MKIRTLDIYMNGEEVGCWSLDSRNEHELTYSLNWLYSKQARPISLSLPLRPSNKPYRGATVASFFDNLLPDSREIRARIQARFQVGSPDPFLLLAAIGRDCVGAIQLVPPGEPIPNVKVIEGTELDESGIELRLAGSTRSPLLREPEYDVLRYSLAGAQEKIALLHWDGGWLSPVKATPTTHILKLPLGQLRPGFDLSTSVENEWLCHLILKALQIPVASCSIEQFGAFKVLVVERFDRRIAKDRSWILRIPQEDFCQATGTPATHKYENEGGPGIETCMKLLEGAEDPVKDRQDFFRTQVLYWMLCATDGHAKNFSLFLEPAGRYRLTPRYDVISAFPYLGNGPLSQHNAKLAMSVRGKNRHYDWNRIRPRHWLQTAAAAGMPDAEAILAELAASAPAAVNAVNAQLPTGFPAAVAEPILSGLLKAAADLG